MRVIVRTATCPLLFPLYPILLSPDADISALLKDYPASQRYIRTQLLVEECGSTNLIGNDELSTSKNFPDNNRKTYHRRR